MNLVFYLYAFSLGVGLMNLMPIVPLDGGLMIKAQFDDAKVNKPHAWKWATAVGLALIVLSAALPSIMKLFIKA